MSKDNIVILIDTMILIYHINKTDKNEIYALYDEAKKKNACLAITDMSMVELIIGCKDKEEIEKIINELMKFNILILGRNDELKILFAKENMEKVIKEGDIGEFKSRICDLKNKECYYFFKRIYITFSATLLSLLTLKDYNYWYKISNYYREFMKMNEGRIEDILLFAFNQTLSCDRKNSSILEIFVGILCAILPLIDAGNYNKDVLIEKLICVNSQKLYKDLFSMINDEINNEHHIEFMNWFKKKNEVYFGDNVIEEMSILYVVSMIIIDRAKLDIHDFVDMYNLSMISTKEKSLYFTNDNKWNRFMDILETNNFLKKKISLRF